MIMLPLILLHYTAAASDAEDYEFACEKKSHERLNYMSKKMNAERERNYRVFVFSNNIQWLRC